MKKHYTLLEKFLYKNELITNREWQQVFKQKDHQYFTEIVDGIPYYVQAQLIEEKRVLKLINYKTKLEEKIIICK